MSVIVETKVKGHCPQNKNFTRIKKPKNCIILPHHFLELTMKHFSQFHENMRSLRLKNGWGQKVIAGNMGISQSAYNRLERGESKMTAEKKQKIAAALRMPEEEVENLHLIPHFYNIDQNGDIHHAACTFHQNMDDTTLEGFRQAINAFKDQVAALSAQLEQLKANDQFQKELITRLMEK